jgi:hypothetical protein
VKLNGQKLVNGLLKTVSTYLLQKKSLHPVAPIDVHFLEASSLTGHNVEAPFLLAARSILLSIESGILDPEQAGSGVSYGDRALRRVNSSSRLSFGSFSGSRRRGTVRLKLSDWIQGRKCC